MLPYEINRLDATLDVIQQCDTQREHLFSLSRYLKQQLVNVGITIRSDSQIITLETGDENNTELVRNYLESHGIFGAVFCQPATTPNKNIIRFSLNSSMTKRDADKIVDVCARAFREPYLYIL
jgi:CAI-1 autoinducer synthase